MASGFGRSSGGRVPESGTRRIVERQLFVIIAAMTNHASRWISQTTSQAASLTVEPFEDEVDCVAVEGELRANDRHGLALAVLLARLPP